MTHLEAIRACIEADAPCSLAHVMHWATSQGFGGSKAVQAIQQLKTDRVIETSTDDEGSIVVDLI